MAFQFNFAPLLSGVSVDAPAAGEAVDCTSDTAMYRLQLSQELLSRTRLRDVAGYQVGWVDGIVGVQPDGDGKEVPVLLASWLVLKASVPVL